MKKIFLITLTLFTAQISSGQWEDDVRLTFDGFSSITAQYSGAHAIASSGDTVHIVWNDYRDGNHEIYYNRSFDNGSTWDTDIRLTIDPFLSIEPSIAISGQIIHVSWINYLNENNEIYYKRSADGGISWGEDTCLTNTPGSSYQPCLIASDSFIHMVYFDNCDGWWEIYYMRSTDKGVTWEPAIRLTNDPSFAGSPTICASGPVLHVTWQDRRAGNSELYYKRSTDNGISWEEDTRLTYNDSISGGACVGASASIVHLVWMDKRSGNYDVYYKSSTDEGISWGPDISLTENYGESWCPVLAVSGSGLFVIWRDDTDGNREIYYKHSLDGGLNWETDIRLTDNPHESTNDFISVSGTQVNVIWCDDRDGNQEIYYKRDPTGNFPVGIEDEQSLNSGDQISFYPNPAGRQLTVGQSSVVGRQSSVRLSILDLYGRAIKEIGDVLSFPYQLDISDLPDGVYLLRIGDKEGSMKSIKFLKIGE